MIALVSGETRVEIAYLSVAGQYGTPGGISPDVFSVVSPADAAAMGGDREICERWRLLTEWEVSRRWPDTAHEARMFGKFRMSALGHLVDWSVPPGPVDTERCRWKEMQRDAAQPIAGLTDEERARASAWLHAYRSAPLSERVLAQM